MKKSCSIFWFRRDLRLLDNRGLYHALNSDYPVVPIFIFDKTILSKLKNKEDRRVQFIHDTLNEIKNELTELGSNLQVYYDNPKDAWKKVIEDFDVKEVYCNEDYEPNAIKRDEQVEKILKTKNIDLYSFKDQCIFAKNEVLKNDGKPYVVYTPYKRRWRELLSPDDILSINTKKHFKNFQKFRAKKMPSLKELGFVKCDSLVGKTTVKSSLLTHYKDQRDIPALDGTSRFGVHLRFGTISVRKCAQLGIKHSETWLDELIWREFFMQILYHFPHVEKGPFREQYSKIKWKNSKSEFKKWCEGRTGYPLVDAGMRELNATGHMHNRVRMVAASFVIKHLLIDWRWGEKYFAEKLLDFDLSANNGNWQWVAGSGCDAAPYFRVFNPERQIERFDKDYKYIKKWVPEYGTDDYPKPMIEHKFAYQRAIIEYKKAVG